MSTITTETTASETTSDSDLRPELEGREALTETGKVVTILEARGRAETLTARFTGQLEDWQNVTLLPKVGEYIETETIEHDHVAGVWLGTFSTMTDRVGGFVLRTTTPHRMWFTRANVDAERVPTRVATPLEHERMAAATRAGLAAIKAHEEWVATLTEDAHEMADRHNMCEEFDNFMTDHDLEPRQRDYEMTVHVCTTVTLTRAATSDENAAEMIDEADIIAELTSNQSLDNWEVTDTEEV